MHNLYFFHQTIPIMQHTQEPISAPFYAVICRYKGTNVTISKYIPDCEKIRWAIERAELTAPKLLAGVFELESIEAYVRNTHFAEITAYELEPVITKTFGHDV